MENFFPEHLLELLVISMTFSVILMMLIQKLKKLSFITKSWQVWFLNLIFSFLLGIPFTIAFYKLTVYDGTIWGAIVLLPILFHPILLQKTMLANINQRCQCMEKEKLLK